MALQLTVWATRLRVGRRQDFFLADFFTPFLAAFTAGILATFLVAFLGAGFDAGLAATGAAFFFTGFFELGAGLDFLEVDIRLFLTSTAFFLTAGKLSRTASTVFLTGSSPSADDCPTIAPAKPPMMAPIGPPTNPPTIAPPMPPAVCLETVGRSALGFAFFAMVLLSCGEVKTSSAELASKSGSQL